MKYEGLIRTTPRMNLENIYHKEASHIKKSFHLHEMPKLSKYQETETKVVNA